MAGAVPRREPAVSRPRVWTAAGRRERPPASRCCTAATNAAWRWSVEMG